MTAAPCSVLVFRQMAAPPAFFSIRRRDSTVEFLNVEDFARLQELEFLFQPSVENNVYPMCLPGRHHGMQQPHGALLKGMAPQTTN